MLTEICQYLKNWFNRKPDGSDFPKFVGAFTVAGGEIDGAGIQLADGQYFRVIGSVFNDGVHRKGDSDLKDETFDGAVWSMGVPPAVERLASDIAEWQAKYGGADSAAMSPFASESFGGYSYSKASGYSSNNAAGSGSGWQTQFAARLAPWRKM